MPTSAISAYDTLTRGRVTVHYASALATGDVTAAARLGNYNLKKLAIVLSGTAGTTNTVSVQGSLDGTSWGPLHDQDGTTIGVTALDAAGATIEDIRECQMPFIRASVASGSGGAWVVKFVGEYD